MGLEDLLFKYGVRVNYNLVADLQCNYVPVNTAPAGEEARFTMMPWVYHPLLAGPVTLGSGVFVGPNASISSGVTVGSHAHITVGAVVTRDVAEGARVSGNFAIDHDRLIQHLRDIR